MKKGSGWVLVLVGALASALVQVACGQGRHYVAADASAGPPPFSVDEVACGSDHLATATFDGLAPEEIAFTVTPVGVMDSGRLVTLGGASVEYGKMTVACDTGSVYWSGTVSHVRFVVREQ